MPRRSAGPDAARVWEALDLADRDTIARAERAFGVEPGGWPHVPPLRELAVTLGALTLARTWPELSESDALDRALETLGVPDDSDRATRPADSLARKLRGWRKKSSGHG